MTQVDKKQILSYGKMHGLNVCSNANNIFNILALDHRSALIKPLGHPSNPKITFDNIVAFKREIVAELSPTSTAVLLDPSYGVGPSLATNSFPPQCGLVVTVEKSGYDGEKNGRISRLGDDWGVEAISRIGANAVKLLIYYHPESSQAEPMQEFTRVISENCKKHDIALFLETLSYSLDPDQPALTTSEKRQVVIETARQLTSIGGDVYKAEFPVNTNETNDVTEWEDACRELTEASKIPWVLLSAGVDYETFARQTEVACRSGASGILAGRAIWKEAVDLSGQDRTNFIRETALPRMQKLDEICRAEATPWTDWYTGPPTEEAWYEDYNAKGLG